MRHAISLKAMFDNVFARRAWAEPETCMREGVALTTAWPRTVAACMWTSASWHDLLECGGLHGTCQCSATAVEDVPWPPKAESRQNAQTAHVQRQKSMCGARGCREYIGPHSVFVRLRTFCDPQCRHNCLGLTSFVLIERQSESIW